MHVEDFDRRPAPADVTYCPKSNFALREAPVGRLDRAGGVRFLWHSACSCIYQAALTKTASDNKKKSENTPPQTSKQASDQ